MKNRTINTEDITPVDAVCCGPTNPGNEVTEPCCEQDAGAVACCDKSDSKENNSLKTNCC